MPRRLDSCHTKLPSVISVTPKVPLGWFLLGDLVSEAPWPVSPACPPQSSPHPTVPLQPRAGPPTTGTGGAPGACGWAAPGPRPSAPTHHSPLLPRSPSCAGKLCFQTRQRPKMRLQSSLAWIRSLVLSPISFGILGKLLSLFVPQFPQLYEWDNISSRHKLDPELKPLTESHKVLPLPSWKPDWFAIS